MVTSIATLVHVARKIAESMQAIKDSPRLIRTVASETEVLASIFSQLKEKLTPAVQILEDSRKQLQALLKRMETLLAELEKELDGIAADSLGLLD